MYGNSLVHAHKSCVYRDSEVCLNLCDLHLFQMVSALPLVMLLRVEGKTSPPRLSKKWLLRIFILVLNSKILHWSQWTQEATQSSKASPSLLHSRFQCRHATLLPTNTQWEGALRDDTKNGCQQTRLLLTSSNFFFLLWARKKLGLDLNNIPPLFAYEGNNELFVLVCGQVRKIYLIIGN